MSQQNMPYFGANEQQNQQAAQQQAGQQNQQAAQQQQAGQQQAAFTEKDMVEDLLGCHKALANSYSVLILEASCPALRNILMENWQQTVTDQYTIFDQMRTRGWYQMPQAQQQEITTSKQQFAQMLTQLQ